jgi:hypothetical protein
VSCTFTAPALNPDPALNTYRIVVVTPEGTTERSLTVVAATTPGCVFP